MACCSTVALLVAPWLGFLLNTWLGALIGVVLYVGSRLFSPEEERVLSKTLARPGITIARQSSSRGYETTSMTPNSSKR